MRVSFIIPLFNCLPLTQAMLASLRATLPAGVEPEIILVDDGSTDGTREWLATLDGAQRVILNERNLGFAATCNRGAAAATGDVIFFLNNDLVLLPGWLPPMLELLATDHLGVVGNVQYNYRTGEIDHAGIRFNAKGKPEHLSLRGWWGRRVRPVVAVTGACLALSRSLWTELGGFDPVFVNGAEDVDLCLRARRTGRQNVVALRSRVRHHISASFGRKARDEQNTLTLVRRWRSDIERLLARPVALACVAASWRAPHNYADPLGVLDALWFLTGLKTAPSARLRAAIATAIDVELARWAELLQGRPHQAESEIAPALYPKSLPPAPIL